MILWTRRPYGDGGPQKLTVEVARDAGFRHVVSHAPVTVSASGDWTARIVVGGLEPATTYWYRFSDAEGNGSRIGRTRTAPADNDPRPVNFAFVSCQDVNEGKLNAYRKMIFEDEREVPANQLDFVLHLGDFIYEVVEYPEELPTRYDRTIYEVARLPDGAQGRRFPHPAHRRRLPRDLSRLSARSRPAGCPRALAVRGDLGQSRVLVGRLPERAQGAAAGAARPDGQGRRQPGVVRIHPRAGHGADGALLDRFDPPQVENVEIETTGTMTGWATSRTTSPRSTA